MPDGVFNPYQTVLAIGQSTLPMITPSGNGSTVGTIAQGAVVTGGHAVTLAALTALPAYAVGQSCYVYIAAAQIAAGQTAGWYYGTILGTASLTLYNNTYIAPGTPAPPSPLAGFASITGTAITTGTGATIIGYQYQVPAGMVIGPNDGLRISLGFSGNAGSTSTKACRLYFGTAGTTSDTAIIANAVPTADNDFWPIVRMQNRGANTMQIWPQDKSGTSFQGTSGNALTNVNMANVSYISIQNNVGTNTDFVVHESTLIEYVKGVA